MKRSTKIKLALLAFLSFLTVPALADYIANGVRTLDYSTSNGDIRFMLSKAGVMTDMLHIQGSSGNVGVGSSSPAKPLDVVGTTGATVYASAATNSSSAGNTNWTRAPKNTVSLFVGDNDNTSGYAANDFSGDIRFNGTGSLWGDIGYYPQGGATNGHFRFSLAGTTVDTSPDATVGVGKLSTGDGTSSSPAVFFQNCTDCGIYNSGAGPAFANASTFIVGAGGSDGSFGLLARDGAVSKPSYSWNSDSDTGLRWVSSGIFRATSNGADILQVAPGGLNSGDIGTASLIKWKVFAGTLAASTDATLTSPGTVVLSVSGVSSDGTDTRYNTIQDEAGAAGGASEWIHFRNNNASSNSNAVVIRNYNSATTSTYKIIMFYQ